jgi:hypothetical protein
MSNPNKPTKAERAQRREWAESYLRKILAPGSTVYYTVRHVADSGMSRSIDFYVVAGGRLAYVSGALAHLLDLRQDKHGAIVRKGCGTDLGFDTVYLAGCALWPNGTPEPHGTRNGKPDSDGGYALTSESF